MENPLSSLLGAPPRLVTSVADVIRDQASQPPEATPAQRLGSLFGTAQANRPFQVVRGGRSNEYADEEEPFVPLTTDEIKTRARSNAQIAAGFMQAVFGFVNRFVAAQELEKTDRILLKAHDQHERAYLTLPDLTTDGTDDDSEQQREAAQRWRAWNNNQREFDDPAHPIHEAKQRWDSFQGAIELADKEAEIGGYQRQMLEQAFESELRAKNKKGPIKPDSPWMLMAKLMAIQVAYPLANLHKRKLTRY